jgi:hypothetical protein
MRTWRQRPCGEVEARGRVERTPAFWRAFADRNAALAAALLATAATAATAAAAAPAADR